MTTHNHGTGGSPPIQSGAYDEFVAAVEAATGRGARGHGENISLCCPAHDDRHPSLSVREGDDGRVLAHCFAGCTPEEVFSAIGRTTREFGPTEDVDQGEWTPAGSAVAVYSYCDAAGELLSQVCRTADKQFRQRRPDPDNASGWRWNLDGVHRVLYRLPEVLAAVAEGETVYVCEGERDVETLRALGLAATCNPGGAGKWQDEYSESLRDATVVVIADADGPGRRHAREVGESLEDVSANVTLLEPAIGKDITDHLELGLSLDDVVPLGAEKAAGDTAVSEKKSKQSAADRLIALTSEAELFRTTDWEAFASFEADGHRETWPIDSFMFTTWLSSRSYEAYKNVPSSTTLVDVITALKGRALHGGVIHDVHARVARHEDTIYLDLGDTAWQAVAIEPTGWRIITEPPIRFRRSPATAALPLPLSGGSIEELRPFINADADGWILICSWLAAALRPTGPFPLLDLVGEQGSAKSTTARVLVQLVDPNKVPLRSAPHDGRDLMISAHRTWVLAFDNLSAVREWLSDALCRLSTGGGFATRQLYTDVDEIVLDAQRPVILTGIGDHSTRSDLLDRELLITLPAISEQARTTEREFWERFEQARARILGALLDAVVYALAHEHEVTLEQAPRMADFAVWAAAAAPALGWTGDEFLAAYRRNRGDVNAVAIDDAPVAPAVLELAETGFRGTASELLERLASLDEAAAKRQGWPKAPGNLSATLRRLAPNFRALGVEIEIGRETTGNKKRYIAITTTGAADTHVTNVTGVTDEAEVQTAGDDGDAAEAAVADPTHRPPGSGERTRRFRPLGDAHARGERVLGAATQPDPVEADEGQAA
jgi:hypothetical protein